MNGSHAAGGVTHPDWCEESECSVRADGEGTHASQRELIADREDPHLATAVFIKQNARGKPWLVVRRLHDGADGVSLRWRLGSARDVHALLGQVLDRYGDGSQS